MSRLHNYKPLILLFFFSFCFFAGGQIARLFPPASVRTDDKSPSGNAASSGTVPTASTSGNPLSTILPAAENWGLSFQEEGKVPVGNASFNELQQYHAYYAQKTDKKVIYLTFDCGYENGNTEPILDALKKHDVKATFFVVGNFLETSPEIVKRMIAEGHTVGNHTYHHVEITRVPDETAQEEILMTNEVITGITGEEVSYMRPPFGVWQKNLERKLDVMPVLWTIDPLDWTTDNEDEIINKVVTQAGENDIILLHDCYESSVNAALRIVDILQKEGFEFVTVDELIMN